MAFEQYGIPGDEYEAIWIDDDSIIAVMDGGPGPDAEDTVMLLTGPGERERFYVIGKQREVVQRLNRARAARFAERVG